MPDLAAQAKPVCLAHVSSELCAVWGGASHWPWTVTGQKTRSHPAGTANREQPVKVSVHFSSFGHQNIFLTLTTAVNE